MPSRRVSQMPSLSILSETDVEVSSSEDSYNYSDEYTMETTDETRLGGDGSGCGFGSWIWGCGGSSVEYDDFLSDDDDETDDLRKFPMRYPHKRRQRRKLRSKSSSNTHTDDVSMTSVSDLSAISRPVIFESGKRMKVLARYAARAKHEVSGVPYNKSLEVDSKRDIQVMEIHIQLPMGILFHENGGGCWVAKMLPNGNAALKAIGGKVEPGDQLVAINGRSSMNMKVDDVWSAVSRYAVGSNVKFTFIRYIGRLANEGSPSKGTSSQSITRETSTGNLVSTHRTKVTGVKTDSRHRRSLFGRRRN